MKVKRSDHVETCHPVKTPEGHGTTRERALVASGTPTGHAREGAVGQPAAPVVALNSLGIPPELFKYRRSNYAEAKVNQDMFLRKLGLRIDE